MTHTTSVDALLAEFCQQHALPEHYSDLATRYFLPLAEELAKKSAAAQHSLFIGINGCQGSGKSTLAELLQRLLSDYYGLSVANLSIDDFYLTKRERVRLAETQHPLFLTRGVPGTHDLKLLKQTLSSLQNQHSTTPIPRFDKGIDDRAAPTHWDSLQGAADIVLLEGWCVGVSVQDSGTLPLAINTLERNEDPQGLWRQYINDVIAEEYEHVFAKLDLLIMLKAPSFDCVYQWRSKQEEKLRQTLEAAGKSTQSLMDTPALRRFIEHYQRLTEHMLAVLPQQAHIVFELDEHHRICGRLNNGNP